MKPLKKRIATIKGGGMFPDREVYLADEADARIAELEAERDEARADAERYRWLRSANVGPASIWELLSEDCSPPIMTLKCGAELDAAIDAARAKPKA